MCTCRDEVNIQILSWLSVAGMSSRLVSCPRMVQTLHSMAEYQAVMRSEPHVECLFHPTPLFSQAPRPSMSLALASGTGVSGWVGPAPDADQPVSRAAAGCAAASALAGPAWSIVIVYRQKAGCFLISHCAFALRMREDAPQGSGSLLTRCLISLQHTSVHKTRRPPLPSS
jgi:hypothetical protein